MSQSGARQTALVTGASFGIGYQFAKFFAADRYDVILVARTEEKLEAVKKEIEEKYGVAAHVIVADLSDPDSARAIHRVVGERGLRVDVLVNNAGFGGYGFFHETDLDHELRMIQVNVTSLVALTKLFVRDMLAGAKRELERVRAEQQGGAGA